MKVVRMGADCNLSGDGTLLLLAMLVAVSVDANHMAIGKLATCPASHAEHSGRRC